MIKYEKLENGDFILSKISVIIPVYNVEKYLSQCLDSITNQTFKDFECICVNDGSTDNSLKILEEYVKKDNRFKVINQVNSGNSQARNTGINNSNSEYIVFIDSDDFVSSDYLEKLLNIAIKENSDIVYCRHKLYYDLDDRYESGPNRDKLNKLFSKYNLAKNNNKIKYVLDIVDSSRSICMKIYKSNVIKNNNLLLFTNIHAEGDYSFNILANLYSAKINFLDEELYYYRKQIKSITTKIETFRINSIKSFICLTKELYKRKFLDNSKFLQKFVIDMFVVNVGKKIPKSKIDIIMPIVTDHFNWLKSIFTNSIELKFYSFIVKILGPKSLILFRVLKNIK